MNLRRILGVVVGLPRRLFGRNAPANSAVRKEKPPLDSMVRSPGAEVTGHPPSKVPIGVLNLDEPLPQTWLDFAGKLRNDPKRAYLILTRQQEEFAYVTFEDNRFLLKAIVAPTQPGQMPARLPFEITVYDSLRTILMNQRVTWPGEKTQDPPAPSPIPSRKVEEDIRPVQPAGTSDAAPVATPKPPVDSPPAAALAHQVLLYDLSSMSNLQNAVTAARGNKIEIEIPIGAEKRRGALRHQDGAFHLELTNPAPDQTPLQPNANLRTLLKQVR